MGLGVSVRGGVITGVGLVVPVKGGVIAGWGYCGDGACGSCEG